MIRLRLAELLAEKAFQEKRRIEWKEVAEHTGLHRTTISKMLNIPGYNASIENIDHLCRYFKCEVGDIAVYVEDPLNSGT